LNNLTILENGIVPVYKGENGQAVNARELHEFLEVGTKFADWIKDRIEKYGFAENEDFVCISEKRETQRNDGQRGLTPITEYILTMDTAKEIAMVQNNDKGSQARKYFIAVEKKFKETAKPQCIEDILIQSLQEMKDMKQQLSEVNHNALVANTKSEETKQEIQAIRDVITLNPTQWKIDVTNILSKIAKQRGGTSEMYKEVRDESYRLLNERAGSKLSIRLTNMKRKVLEETGSKSKADKVSKIDVIATDKKLIEIYISVVTKMAIKYKVA
jgi:anti-repressor protein